MNSKSIFISILFISLTSLAVAQSNSLRIGVDGGPSLVTNMGSFEYVSMGFATGYSFAGNIQYTFKRFSIVSGIGLERKGNSQTTKPGFPNLPIEEYVYFRDYLNIPLLFRYTFGSKRLAVFANVGGYLGIRQKSKFFLKDAGPDDAHIQKYEKKMEDLDFGLSAGVGLKYPISRRFNMLFEARNNYGLVYLNRNSTINYGNNKSQQYSLNFLVGLNMKLGSVD